MTPSFDSCYIYALRVGQDKLKTYNVFQFKCPIF